MYFPEFFLIMYCNFAIFTLPFSKYSQNFKIRVIEHFTDNVDVFEKFETKVPLAPQKTYEVANLKSLHDDQAINI